MHDDLSKTLFGNFGSSGTFLRSYGLLRTSASIWLEKGRYSVYRSSAGYIYLSGIENLDVVIELGLQSMSDRRWKCISTCERTSKVNTVRNKSVLVLALV